MNTLERVRALRDRLKALDSASGEAADISALLKTIEAAKDCNEIIQAMRGQPYKPLTQCIEALEKDTQG